MKKIMLLVSIALFTVGTMANTNGNPLMAYFPFNGNANDSTGNGYDGVVSGGNLTDGKDNNANSAYTFPSLGGQIQLNNSTNENLQGGFTLNAWVKMTSTNCGIMGKHSCWVPNGFYFCLEASHIRLYVCGSSWNTLLTDETYPDGTWHMLTAVYDSINQTHAIFVDGIMKKSGPCSYTTFNSVPITISQASSGCPDGNLTSAIDEVRIFNTPLSDVDILSLYNAENTVGLKENKLTFQLSPNPSVGTCSIDLPNLTKQVEVTISDTGGRVVSEKTYTDVQHIDLNIQTTPGIYLVTVTTESFSVTEKLILK